MLIHFRYISAFIRTQVIFTHFNFFFFFSNSFQVLDLENNHLKKLPASFEKLTNLCHLNLKSNFCYIIIFNIRKPNIFTLYIFIQVWNLFISLCCRCFLSPLDRQKHHIKLVNHAGKYVAFSLSLFVGRCGAPEG